VEIIGPIQDEMKDLRDWMIQHTFASSDEFDIKARRYAILSVKLYIITHQW
jgi:hypothetical protein